NFPEAMRSQVKAVPSLSRTLEDFVHKPTREAALEAAGNAIRPGFVDITKISDAQLMELYRHLWDQLGESTPDPIVKQSFNAVSATLIARGITANNLLLDKNGKVREGDSVKDLVFLKQGKVVAQFP